MEDTLSQQSLKHQAELRAYGDRVSAVSLQENRLECNTHVLKTDVALLEASALGRHDEITEVQVRLSQSQRQACRETVELAASYHLSLQKHRTVLDEEHRRNVESLRAQVASFASTSDERTQALVREILSVSSDRDRLRQEVEQQVREISSMRIAAQRQVQQATAEQRL